MSRRTFGLIAAFSLLPVLVLLVAATPYQNSEPRRPKGWDNLEVGQLVDVKAVLTGEQHTIVATYIDVSGAKLVAPIQYIDVANSILLILGVKVLASPETKITNREDVPIDFSTLQIGSRVVVQGQYQDDGTVKARQIILKDKSNEVIIEGILQRVDNNRNKLTVLGIPVSVTADTYIELD